MAVVPQPPSLPSCSPPPASCLPPPLLAGGCRWQQRAPTLEPERAFLCNQSVCQSINQLIDQSINLQLLEAGGKARFDLRTRETLLVHHAFAGCTRNQVECLRCGGGGGARGAWRAEERTAKGAPPQQSRVERPRCGGGWERAGCGWGGGCLHEKGAQQRAACAGKPGASAHSVQRCARAGVPSISPLCSLRLLLDVQLRPR